MKRSTRIEIAKETVAICEAGHYTSASGQRVDLVDSIRHATDGTVLHGLENPPQLLDATPGHGTQFEVTDETTCAALERLRAQSPDHLACLNFASAKNPGGGFLNGAEAQEEALARSSALYPCLLKQPKYYEHNRAHGSSLYLDLVIYSPLVPFFRRDDGMLLEDPVLASVITAPAPNAGAIADNEPERLAELEPTLHRRTQLVLEVARAHQVTRLVLGAWGCGVFRNDPKQVALIFTDLLRDPFKNRFEQVVFAIFDKSPGQTTYQAFKSVIGR
jgi:uncharacterized protein (TIGR02452 family)